MEKKSTIDIRDLAYVDSSLDIQKAVSHMHMPQPNELVSLLKENKKRRYFPFHRCELPLLDGDEVNIFISSVVIDPHATERWNERIGPLTKEDELTHIFSSIIISQQYRVEFLDHEFGILDREIAFSYTMEESVMTITTFFGRISTNISLSNIDVLRRYNKHFNEQIQLHLSTEELESYSFPIAPKTSIEFKLQSNHCRLDFYQNQTDQNQYYVVSMCNMDAMTWEIKLIDLQHANRTRISESVLYILGIFDHSEFLIRYLKQFHKERFQNLYNIYSKRALHKYMGFKYKR